MDASRPLLANDRDCYDDAHHHRKKTRNILDHNHRCYERLCPFLFTSATPPPSSSASSSSTASSTMNGDHPHRLSGSHSSYTSTSDVDDRACWQRALPCTKWDCWKWLFPERIADYDDFATSAQMGEIYFIRQKARESFEPNNPEDEEMLHHLWNGLFPTLPYEGRVNARWRDVGFQNDDPASDLRASGRLALNMLLYFSDHLNDEFKRMVRENRFPVCLCALNMIEVLLIHLNLKDPPPLICPCCGTENAELETSSPSRSHPELKGFTSILDDASNLTSSNQLVFAEWPVEVALGQVFMHSMIVLDAVWKQKLYRDPTINLMYFREALEDTRLRLVAFLSRRKTPLTLLELSAWSFRQKTKKKVLKTI